MNSYKFKQFRKSTKMPIWGLRWWNLALEKCWYEVWSKGPHQHGSELFWTQFPIKLYPKRTTKSKVRTPGSPCITKGCTSCLCPIQSWISFPFPSLSRGSRMYWFGCKLAIRFGSIDFGSLDSYAYHSKMTWNFISYNSNIAITSCTTPCKS